MGRRRTTPSGEPLSQTVRRHNAKNERKTMAAMAEDIWSTIESGRERRLRLKCERLYGLEFCKPRELPAAESAAGLEEKASNQADAAEASTQPAAEGRAGVDPTLHASEAEHLHQADEAHLRLGEEKANKKPGEHSDKVPSTTEPTTTTEAYLTPTECGNAALKQLNQSQLTDALQEGNATQAEHTEAQSEVQCLLGDNKEDNISEFNQATHPDAAASDLSTVSLQPPELLHCEVSLQEEAKTEQTYAMRESNIQPEPFMPITDDPQHVVKNIPIQQPRKERDSNVLADELSPHKAEDDHELKLPLNDTTEDVEGGIGSKKSEESKGKTCHKAVIISVTDELTDTMDLHEISSYNTGESIAEHTTQHIPSEKTQCSTETHHESIEAENIDQIPAKNEANISGAFPVELMRPNTNKEPKRKKKSKRDADVIATSGKEEDSGMSAMSDNKLAQKAKQKRRKGKRNYESEPCLTAENTEAVVPDDAKEFSSVEPLPTSHDMTVAEEKPQHLERLELSQHSISATVTNEMNGNHTFPAMSPEDKEATKEEWTTVESKKGKLRRKRSERKSVSGCKLSDSEDIGEGEHPTEEANLLVLISPGEAEQNTTVIDAFNKSVTQQTRMEDIPPDNTESLSQTKSASDQHIVKSHFHDRETGSIEAKVQTSETDGKISMGAIGMVASSETGLADRFQDSFDPKESNFQAQVNEQPGKLGTTGDSLTVLDAFDILLSSDNDLSKGLLESLEPDDLKQTEETHMTESMTDEPPENVTTTKLDDFAASEYRDKDLPQASLVQLGHTGKMTESKSQDILNEEYHALDVHSDLHSELQPGKVSTSFAERFDDANEFGADVMIEDSENGKKQPIQECQSKETYRRTPEALIPETTEDIEGSLALAMFDNLYPGYGLREPDNRKTATETEDIEGSLAAFDSLLPGNDLCERFLDSFELEDRKIATGAHGIESGRNGGHKELTTTKPDDIADQNNMSSLKTPKKAPTSGETDPDTFSELQSSKDRLGSNVPSKGTDELMYQTMAEDSVSREMHPTQKHKHIESHYEVPEINSEESSKNMDAFDILLSSGNDLYQGFLDSLEPDTTKTETHTQVVNSILDERPEGKSLENRDNCDACESKEVGILPHPCGELQSTETKDSSNNTPRNTNELIVQATTEDSISRGMESKQDLTPTDVYCDIPETKESTEDSKVLDAFDILLSSGDDFYEGLLDSMGPDDSDTETGTHLFHAMPHKEPVEDICSKLQSSETSFTQVASMEALQRGHDSLPQLNAPENADEGVETVREHEEAGTSIIHAADMSLKDKTAVIDTLGILTLDGTELTDSPQETFASDGSITKLHAEESPELYSEANVTVIVESETELLTCFIESKTHEKELPKTNPESSEAVDAFDLLLSSGENLHEGFLESFETQETAESGTVQNGAKHDSLVTREVITSYDSQSCEENTQHNFELESKSAANAFEIQPSTQSLASHAEEKTLKPMKTHGNHADALEESSIHSGPRQLADSSNNEKLPLNAQQVFGGKVCNSEHIISQHYHQTKRTTQHSDTWTIYQPDNVWYNKAVHDAAEAQYYQRLYGKNKSDERVGQQCTNATPQANHEALNTVVPVNEREINEVAILTHEEMSPIYGKTEFPPEHSQQRFKTADSATSQPGALIATPSPGVPVHANSKFTGAWFDKFKYDMAETQHYEGLARKSRDSKCQGASTCQKGSASESDGSSSYPLYEGSCDHFHADDGQATGDEEFAACEEDVFQDATWTESKLYQTVADAERTDDSLPPSTAQQRQTAEATATAAAFSLKPDTAAAHPPPPVTTDTGDTHPIVSTPTTTSDTANTELMADTQLSADTGISVDTDLLRSSGSVDSRSRRSTFSSAVSPLSPQLELDDIYFEDVVLAGRQSEVTMAALPGFTAAPHSEGLAPGEQLDSLNTEPDLELSEPGTAELLENEGGAQPFPYDGGNSEMMTRTLTPTVGDTQEKRDMSDTSSVTEKTTPQRLVSPVLHVQVPEVTLDSHVEVPVLADKLPSPILDDTLPSPTLREQLPSPTLEADMPLVTLRTEVPSSALFGDVSVPPLAVDIPTPHIPSVVLKAQITHIGARTTAPAETMLAQLAMPALATPALVRALRQSADTQAVEPAETLAQSPDAESAGPFPAVYSTAQATYSEIPSQPDVKETSVPDNTVAEPTPNLTITGRAPISLLTSPAGSPAAEVPAPISPIKSPPGSQTVNASTALSLIASPPLSLAVDAPALIPSVATTATTEAPTLAIGPPTPTQAIEAPVPIQAIESPAPTQAIDAPASTQAIEAPVPIQAIEAPSPSPAIEAPTPTQAIAAPAPTQAIEAPALTQAIGAPALTQAIEAPAPTQAIEAPFPMQAIEAPAPTQAIEAPAPTQAIKAPAPTQAIKAPASTPAIEATAPTQAMETIAPDQTIEATVSSQVKEAPAPTSAIEQTAFIEMSETISTTMTHVSTPIIDSPIPSKEVPAPTQTIDESALTQTVDVPVWSPNIDVSAPTSTIEALTPTPGIEKQATSDRTSPSLGDQTNGTMEMYLNKKGLRQHGDQFNERGHAVVKEGNDKLADKTYVSKDIDGTELKALRAESDEEIISFTGQTTPHSPIVTKKLNRKKKAKSGSGKFQPASAEQKLTLRDPGQMHATAEPPAGRETETLTLETTTPPEVKSSCGAETLVTGAELDIPAAVTIKDDASMPRNVQKSDPLDIGSPSKTKASTEKLQIAEQQTKPDTVQQKISDKQIPTEKSPTEESPTAKESSRDTEKKKLKEKLQPKYAQSSTVKPQDTPSHVLKLVGREAPLDSRPSGRTATGGGSGVAGAPLRSQPVLADRTLFLAGEEGRTYAALMQQGADMMPARAVFTAHACHVCKRLHTRQHRLKSCGSCRLVAYCSPEHQRAHWPLHRALCRVVSRRLRHLGTDHIYREAVNVSSAEQWKRIRFKHMAVCEEMLDRPMEAYEKEMFLYPRACDTCHETSPERLHTCTACHSVSFCSDDHLRKNHAKFCKDLHLLLDVHSYQNQHGVCAPALPDTTLSSYEPLPPHIREFLVVSMLGPQRAMQLGAVELAVLTEIASYPLTLLYALQNIPVTEEAHVSRLQEMTVHVVGAEFSVECDSIGRWDVFLLNVLPRLRRLHVVFIGLELEVDRPNGAFEHETCAPCRAAGKRFTCEFQPNTAYHTYCTSPQFRPPHVVCAFNAGLHRRAGHATRDTWRQSLPHLVQDGVPLIISGYTLLECPQDVALIQQQQRVDVLLPPMKNPYRSTRPAQNFLSEHEAPVVFKNQYVACLMAASKARK